MVLRFTRAFHMHMLRHRPAHPPHAPPMPKLVQCYVVIETKKKHCGPYVDSGASGGEQPRPTVQQPGRRGKNQSAPDEDAVQNGKKDRD